MKSKAAFVLVLIGLILGSLGAVYGVLNYFLFQNFGSALFNVFGNEVGGELQEGIGKILIWSLISSIIGIILSIILIFYTVKIARDPTKGDFIITTILGGLGIFLGLGIGGILILIGGIIGIVNSNNKMKNKRR